jgi:acetyl esterase/lipase
MKGIQVFPVQGEIAVKKPNRIVLYPLDFQKRDLILILPGGGYERTSPREAMPVVDLFHSAGYHAAIYEYRNEIIRYPEIIDRALEEVYALRKTRYIRRLVVLGFSAGGHLALWMLEKKPRWFKAGILAYPVVSADPEIRHAGSIFNLLGGEGDKETLRAVSLEKHVRPTMPPIFLWSTFDDAAVPIENSLWLLEAFRRKKVACEAHIFASGRHGLSLADETTPFEGEDPVTFANQNRTVAAWKDLCLAWLKRLG